MVLRAIVALSLLASPAAAARVESGWFEFPVTHDVHRIEWTLTGDSVPPVHLAFWLPNELAKVFTPARYDRPQWGFVQADWQVAINDPAYTLSTITLDGVSQSGAVVRVGGPVQLELFQFGILLNSYLDYEALAPYIWAIDTAELPEPPTCLLLLSVLVLEARTRRRNIDRPNLRHR